jgi:hypothetical protein
LCICLTGLSAYGQAGSYWSHTYLLQDVEAAILAKKVRHHLSVRPLQVRHLPEGFGTNADTAAILGQAAQRFWNSPDKGKFDAAFLPLIDLGIGASSDEGTLFTTRAGLAANITFGSKLSLYADFMGGIETLPGYVYQFTDSLGVLPSAGNYRREGRGFLNAFPTARLAYAPSQYFEFELGYGRNFFGNGYRSMFLSDVAFNYPYLKITTDVWNVKYVNVFSMLRDVRTDLPKGGPYRNKFTTTHYLSWAVTDWFNLGLFETIVWQSRDTLLERGFDPHYLNPIIFYRPVEFAIGSPDNAIIGLDMSFRLSGNFQLYTQLLLDEFLLSEFRDRTGWWANKWGAQVGAKWFNMLGKQGFHSQLEFNVARPFTYTHGSVLQNFGHFNQPLAHVLGTNFYEVLGRIYREKGPWYGEARMMYALYGRDPDERNFGGDIYRSYANPYQQYGNVIAQGRKSDLYYGELTAGRIINKAMNLRAALKYTPRHISTHGVGKSTEHIIGFSISSALYNSYRDF